MTAIARNASAPIAHMLRRVNVAGLLFVLGLVAVWQIAVSTGIVAVVFFPAPSDIMTAWVGLFASGQMAADVGHTLSSAGIGWALGSTIGLAVGVLLGVFATSWTYGMATVDFLRSIPAICFISVAALLLGFSLEMELVVTTYAAMWPVMINTIEGIRKVEGLHLETARTLQLSKARTLFTILLPGAGGSIIVGLRLALGLALTLAVASEMVGNPAGVGFQLVMQQQALQPASMFAYIITIGVLGVLLNRLFMTTIRLLHPGLVLSLKEES